MPGFSKLHSVYGGIHSLYRSTHHEKLVKSQDPSDRGMLILIT